MLQSHILQPPCPVQGRIYEFDKLTEEQGMVKHIINIG